MESISIVLHFCAIIAKQRSQVAELDVRKGGFEDVDELHRVLIRQKQFLMHFLPVIFLALVIQTLWMKESGKKHNDQSHKSREFVEFRRNLGTILDHIAEFSKRRQLVVLTEKTEKQHRLYPLKNPINPNQIITNTVFPILDGFQIDVVQIRRDLKHIILLEKLLRLEFGAQLAAIAVHRLEHPYNPHLFSPALTGLDQFRGVVHDLFEELHPARQKRPVVRPQHALQIINHNLPIVRTDLQDLIERRPGRSERLLLELLAPRVPEGFRLIALRSIAFHTSTSLSFSSASASNVFLIYS